MLRQLRHPRSGATIIHPAWVFLNEAAPGFLFAFAFTPHGRGDKEASRVLVIGKTQVKEPRASSLIGFWGSYLDFPKALLRDTQKIFSSRKLNLQRMPTPATPSPAALRVDIHGENDNIRNSSNCLVSWDEKGTPSWAHRGPGRIQTLHNTFILISFHKLCQVLRVEVNHKPLCVPTT